MFLEISGSAESNLTPEQLLMIDDFIENLDVSFHSEKTCKSKIDSLSNKINLIQKEILSSSESMSQSNVFSVSEHISFLHTQLKSLSKTKSMFEKHLSEKDYYLKSTSTDSNYEHLDKAVLSLLSSTNGGLCGDAFNESGKTVCEINVFLIIDQNTSKYMKILSSTAYHKKVSFHFNHHYFEGETCNLSDFAEKHGYIYLYAKTSFNLTMDAIRSTNTVISVS